MESTSWDPYGALQAHSLAANLPLVKCRLPHLLLLRTLQFQVRLKWRTLTGINPSRMNTPGQCKRQGGEALLEYLFLSLSGSHLGPLSTQEQGELDGPKVVYRSVWVTLPNLPCREAMGMGSQPWCAKWGLRAMELAGLLGPGSAARAEHCSGRRREQPEASILWGGHGRVKARCRAIRILWKPGLVFTK